MKGSVDLIQTGVNLSLLKVRRNWSDSGVACRSVSVMV